MKIEDYRPPIRHIAQAVVMDYSLRAVKDLWPFVDWQAVDDISYDAPMFKIIEVLTDICHRASTRWDNEAPKEWRSS